MPEDTVRLEEFSRDELLALSVIAVALQQFTSERVERMVRYIAEAKPLVAISGRRLPTNVM